MSRRAVYAAVCAGALVAGVPTAASAHGWWGWHGGHHAPPSASASPTPSTSPTPDDQPEESTPTPTPSASETPEPEASASIAPSSPSPTAEPEDDATAAPEDDATAAPVAQEPSDGGDAQADDASVAPNASFVEDFDTPAAVGQVTSVYPQSWQPYPDGTSGIYEPSKTVSVHDGVMDIQLGGAGAAGTFGTADGAWDHVGGSFSVRAKATGGDGNGAAFMLWPTSGVWSDGEIDFPEGNYDESPSAFQHSMTPGREAERVQVGTGVSWRDWHTYTVDWKPGESVTYSVDGKVLQTITHDVPTTPHRYMFQTGNWGASGNLLIDWVSTTE
jgi:hypothetical protein